MEKSLKHQHNVTLFGGRFSSSFLLQVTLFLQVAGIFLPYCLNINRNDFDPPLPFISQAGGCMPENGLFTCLMIPASYFGFLLCILIHDDMSVSGDFKSRMSTASFWSGIIFFFSWIFICTFPFTYTDLPNKHEWVYYVLWEHMVGALLMLGSCVFFSIFQVLSRWNSTCKTKKERIFIGIVTIPVAMIGLFSLLMLAFEELGADGEKSMKDITYELPSKFSFYYIITSCCEWILVFSMWISLGLFHEELIAKTFSICIRRK